MDEVKIFPPASQYDLWCHLKSCLLKKEQLFQTPSNVSIKLSKQQSIGV